MKQKPTIVRYRRGLKPVVVSKLYRIGCDTWELDRLQKLIEKKQGLVLLPPRHKYASDYRDTAEPFQTGAIHSQELHYAVAAVRIKKDVTFSRNIEFMCRALGIPIPFLLVREENEYRLFPQLVYQMGGFDD